MNIRIVLWTLCMAVAGFLLVGSTPSITSVTIVGLITFSERRRSKGYYLRRRS
jgi:hypothetical protein